MTPTKKLGQNFVHDGNTVRRIVQVAGVQRGETVLEIGPGLGSLTLGLLEAGASVIAVEIDERLAEQLPHTVRLMQPGTTLMVVTDDALRVTELPGEPVRLVANLPYNVSVPVLLHLLEHFPSLTSGIVMVQAEVGHRLAAEPGSKVYGGPSVKAAWDGTWRTAGQVSRMVFWPVPNVDSVLVGFRAGATSPAPRRSVARRSRSSTPRSSSAARCCVRRSRACSAALGGGRADPQPGRRRSAGPRRAADRRGVPAHRPPDTAPSTRERSLHDPTAQYPTGIRWELTGGAVDASRADADETQLARARLAYERRDWAAARAAYARIADRAAIAAEDVDRESRCAWWLGDTAASIAAGEDLVHRLEDAGRDREAAMVALRLGLQWALRGDLAIHAGWYAKARRLLAALPVGPEHRLPAVRHRHAGHGRDGDARRG